MRKPRVRVLPRWAFFVARLFMGFEPAAVTKVPFGISFNRDWWDQASVGRRLRTLRHEMEHWKQYQSMGFLRFHGTYLMYWLRYDYRDNPMEIEARRAE